MQFERCIQCGKKFESNEKRAILLSFIQDDSNSLNTGNMCIDCWEQFEETLWGNFEFYEGDESDDDL